MFQWLTFSFEFGIRSADGRLIQFRRRFKEFDFLRALENAVFYPKTRNVSADDFKQKPVPNVIWYVVFMTENASKIDNSVAK